MSEGNPELKGSRIIIVGAGVGGLSFAIALKRHLGFENFTIFEKADAVGGTWRDNVYPGCSSDIPIHFYSLSSDQKPDWTSSHPGQPEIQAYWDQLSRKYLLYPHINFATKVIKAVWDPTKRLYHVTTQHVHTGQQSTTTANILISALGVLEVPRFPDIPGLSDFQGDIFHSARWVDTKLDGKHVAVIGNGASAAQFMPIISKIPDIHVTQFCRTPSWILPPIRTMYSNAHKWACRYLPLYMRVVRFLNYSLSDIGYFLVFSNSITRRPVTNFVRNHILSNTPEKYHDKIIPTYDLGCKRVIFDSGYLDTLNQSNVELDWDGVSLIVKDGIISERGDHLPFDTIILATGFATDAYPLTVQGKNGQTIQDYFEAQGGPTAYLGTCVPGFPNFFLIGGPNTVTGHTSVIFTEEVQVNYAMQLIKPILEGNIECVDVSSAATDKYNAKIQEKLSRSVFVSCHSWYRVKSDGKVNTMFPGASALFWWWLWRPIWGDYHVMKSEE